MNLNTLMWEFSSSSAPLISSVILLLTAISTSLKKRITSGIFGIYPLF